MNFKHGFVVTSLLTFWIVVPSFLSSYVITTSSSKFWTRAASMDVLLSISANLNVTAVSLETDVKGGITEP